MLKKKKNKLDFFNKSGKPILSVSADGDVIWHSNSNNVNKAEIVEAIYVTIESIKDLKPLLTKAIENDIYNEILQVADSCNDLEDLKTELQGRIIFRKLKE